ncbi:class II fructose-bisphosphate aldolase [Abyssisolibacter fermentans]|uniref:class II fructose-bisphosphate aldolase n=1 Tax=Abyssisolibacter fermentans TaxID=1766203 RepID=UPI0009E8E3B0|nr:class II fructose-bisphosphate aldolase [Abyssisolibacter fermentans]
MLVTTKEMFKVAMQNKFGIAQPNAWDLHSLRAIIRACDEKNAPAIIGLAEVHFNYINLKEFATLVKMYANEVDVPIALHLDHGSTYEGIVNAIHAGFTSVMIDASSKPYEENVKMTKEIVKIAHTCGVTVEAELGHVGMGDNYKNVGDEFTSPEQAKDFIEKTKVDSLAVAIGTAHGEYKGTPKIDFDRLVEIRKKVDVPLVLHGGSGTGDETINKCIKSGISKVNICTDLMKAASKKTKESGKTNYVDLCMVGEDAIKECLEHYFEVFESVNTADIIGKPKKHFEKKERSTFMTA